MAQKPYGNKGLGKGTLNQTKRKGKTAPLGCQVLQGALLASVLVGGRRAPKGKGLGEASAHGAGEGPETGEAEVLA